MNNDNKLQALLSLYNNVISEIDFFQNQGDSTGVINVVTVVIIPLLNTFNVNEFVVFCACLFAPCIVLLNLQRGLQAHTFVAMLRGYAASIEENINGIIGENHYLYNSCLVDRYIASQKVVKSRGLKTSMLTTFIMHYAIIVICIGFFIFYNPYKFLAVYILASIWYLLAILFTTKLCIDFKNKESKRFESKEYCLQQVKN